MTKFGRSSLAILFFSNLSHCLVGGFERGPAGVTMAAQMLTNHLGHPERKEL
jgi:hypothetical protein